MWEAVTDVAGIVAVVWFIGAVLAEDPVWFTAIWRKDKEL